MIASDPRLSVGEAARQAGVSAQHIRNLIHTGRLPATRTAVGFLLNADDIALVRDVREARRPVVR